MQIRQDIRLFGLQKQRHEIQSHLVRWAHLQIQASSTNTTLFPFALQRFVFLSAALYERIFDLPRPVSIFQDEERKSQHLGEVLAGDRMMKTLFSLPFLGIWIIGFRIIDFFQLLFIAVPFEAKKLCTYTLKPSDIEAFQRAIDEEYYFEFIYGMIFCEAISIFVLLLQVLGQTTCQSGDLLARRKFSEETERKERTTIFSLTTSFLWLIMDKRWSGVSILLINRRIFTMSTADCGGDMGARSW